MAKQGKLEQPLAHVLVGKRIMWVSTLDKGTTFRLWGVGQSPRSATPTLLTLDDGSVLLAMQDEEGNGPGVLVRWTADQREEIVRP